jgi:hypothetical protein
MGGRACWRFAHGASQSTSLPSAWLRRCQRAALASIWLLAVSTLQPPRPTMVFDHAPAALVELFADAGAHRWRVVRVQHQQGRLLQHRQVFDGFAHDGQDQLRLHR